jgi:hypothetical protein
MKLPFTETKLEENTYIRIFDEETPDELLVWHRDFEDRIIESIEDTNWGFQLDNQLPIQLKKQIYIPKGVYHRLIKGDGDLKIKLQKL